MNTPAQPVYWHDCPMLGPHTRVQQAVLVSDDRQYILGYRRVCIFCGTEGGEIDMAPGVTLLPNGQYVVDPTTALRVPI